MGRPMLPEWFSCPTGIIFQDRGRNDFFPSLRGQSTFEDLFRVLCALAAVSEILNEYRAVSISFVDIIRARNTAQHRLLSLLARDAQENLHGGIYEACRLAASIYSDMVIFPMPGTAKVKPRLAMALRGTLERLQTGSIDSHLILWVLVLGTIGAFRTGNHDWYLGRLREHSARLKLTHWSEVRVIMKKHLWFDAVCDAALRKIWDLVHLT